jgi:hypothetical protein
MEQCPQSAGLALPASVGANELSEGAGIMINLASVDHASGFCD